MTRIMVINDTKEILELFDILLSDEGYEVVLSSYGVEEIKAIEKADPDLLILDYTIGAEQNGWQLLQKLKMNRATAKIPVIICTTESRLAKEIEGYLFAKGVGLVPKPFDIEDLLSAVAAALESPNKTVGGNETQQPTNGTEPKTHTKAKKDENQSARNGH